MENKLVAGIVAAAVVVILIAGVLMPALSNATSTDDTFTNDGYFRMSRIDDTAENITVVWDHTKPHTFTVNSTDYEISTIGRAISMVFGDDWIIRYNDSTTNVTVQGFHMATNSFAGPSASVNNGKDMTITLSQGTMTMTNGTDTRTMSYTDGFYIDPNGSYIMRNNADDGAYVKGSDIVEGRGDTVLWENSSNITGFMGSIDDGLIGGLYWSTVSGFEDFEINTTANYDSVSSHNDLYKLKSVQYTVLKTGDETPEDVTYTVFAVPYQVTAEKAQHLTNAQIVILDVIPLLIIVSVLLGVVAVFILRRE